MDCTDMNIFSATEIDILFPPPSRFDLHKIYQTKHDGSMVNYPVLKHRGFLHH